MQYEIIGTQSQIALVLMVAIGILLPIITVVVWKVKTKEHLSTILIGASIFIIFAIILESIPKIFLYQLDNPVSRVVMSNIWIYGGIGALLAGLFEETGRFVAFKFLLKKRTNKETAISYGIGHGGFEMMYLLVFTGIQYLTYVSLINSGQFSTIVEQVRMASPNQVEYIESLPATIASITLGNTFISVFERISAMILHVSMSIIVFASVRVPNKKRMYLLAVLIHTVVDLLPCFYQIGLITNAVLFEIILFILVIAVFIITIKVVYKNVLNNYNSFIKEDLT
jgi:uncharacterized membrane protein YhfC